MRGVATIQCTGFNIRNPGSDGAGTAMNLGRPAHHVMTYSHLHVGYTRNHLDIRGYDLPDSRRDRMRCSIQYDGR
jgi:hypothetical protein